MAFSGSRITGEIEPQVSGVLTTVLARSLTLRVTPASWRPSSSILCQSSPSGQASRAMRRRRNLPIASQARMSTNPNAHNSGSAKLLRLLESSADAGELAAATYGAADPDVDGTIAVGSDERGAVLSIEPPF